MKNLVNIEGFKRVDSLNYNDKVYTSHYNFNYYYNEDTNCLILEESDDDNFLSYLSITSRKFLGNIDSEISIFDKDFEDYVEINEEKYVELDTELS